VKRTQEKDRGEAARNAIYEKLLRGTVGVPIIVCAGKGDIVEGCSLSGDSIISPCGTPNFERRCPKSKRPQHRGRDYGKCALFKGL